MSGWRDVLPEPEPGAWRSQMSLPDNKSQHMLCFGEKVAGLEFQTGWAVIRPDRTACAVHTRVYVQFHSEYRIIQRMDPPVSVSLTLSMLDCPSL